MLKRKSTTKSNDHNIKIETFLNFLRKGYQSKERATTIHRDPSPKNENSEEIERLEPSIFNSIN